MSFYKPSANQILKITNYFHNTKPHCKKIWIQNSFKSNHGRIFPFNN